MRMSGPRIVEVLKWKSSESSYDAGRHSRGIDRAPAHPSLLACLRPSYHAYIRCFVFFGYDILPSIVGRGARLTLAWDISDMAWSYGIRTVATQRPS